MRNRHPGVCYRCGQRVEAGAGHFEKIRGARPGEPRWRVQHADCCIKAREERDRAARAAGEVSDGDE